MKHIVVITGQTATGKTAAALQIAHEQGGELINCDSRQLYKGLDIVTGKDINTGEFHLHKRVGTFDIGYYNVAYNGYKTKIWLYDVISPDKSFSAFDYVTCCLEVLRFLLEHNITPVIVGGSYFYLQHLLYPMPEHTVEPNWALREKLEQKPLAELQLLLQTNYPQAWTDMNASDQANPHRLMRRIEVLEQVDESTFTAYREFSGKKDYNITQKLGLSESLQVEMKGFRFENRERMKERIKTRVLARLEQGAIEETKALLQQYPLKSPGLNSIGYIQIAAFLKKAIPKEQLIEEWVNKEYQYAKRQFTFMNRDTHIPWTTIS